ncbi:MAG: anti-sigma factor antagonist [Eubacteriales bacterium]
MEYQIQENCLTIYLPKEVDHFHVADIRIQADRLVETNHIKHIIFDFKHTKFMDSSGIGTIMGRYKLIYLLGGEVWGVHANEHIKKLLLMSGMDRIIQIYEEDEKDEYHK